MSPISLKGMCPFVLRRRLRTDSNQFEFKAKSEPSKVFMESTSREMTVSFTKLQNMKPLAIMKHSEQCFSPS